MADVRVFIATPCAGDLVTTEYFRSMIALTGAIVRSGPSFEIEFGLLASSDVYVARNILSSVFMENERFTHLFFVDADMGFHPSLLQKLLEFNKPFVASLYPTRTESARQAISHTDKRLNCDFVAAKNIISQPADDARRSFQVTNGFVRTMGVGAGAMLLQRSVFTMLRKAYPELFCSPEPSSIYRAMGVKGDVHQCFSSWIMRGQEALSEDLSFCRRWTECGGEIWACVDQDVTHVGQKKFTGAYIHRLKAGLYQSY